MTKKLILLGLIFLISFVSAVNNTFVHFHSLGEENYALQRCTVDSLCDYFESNASIELPYSADWIIKIVPKNESVLSYKFFNKYMNEDVFFKFLFGIGCILVIFIAKDFVKK